MRILMTFIGALAAAGLGAPTQVGAVPVTNGNVNVNVSTESASLGYIAEVALVGPGGGLFSFSDPFAAPGTGDVAGALSLALAGLGLPLGTPLGTASLSALSSFVDFTQTIESDFNPVDDPTVVIGDPTDIETWIAISSINITVQITQTTTTFNPFRVEADIVTTTPVPLPAPAALLAAALAGVVALRRRNSA